MLDRPGQDDLRARVQAADWWHTIELAPGLVTSGWCRSLHDLDPLELGRFLVVLGYVLQMLRDPLRALEAVRAVCRGSLMVVETVSAPLSLLPAPLARLNARRGQLEWFVFNRAGLRQALVMAKFSVEEMSATVRDTAGRAVARAPLEPTIRARHALGLLGRSVAVRAVT